MLTATFFVPIISVLPGLIFESIAKHFVDNTPYSNVGRLATELMLITFAVMLFLGILLVMDKIKKTGQIFQRQIIKIMAVMYFIVHPLGYYIYWGLALNYRGDGQLIFAAMVTFPFSSISFVVMGVLIDKIKNNRLAKYIEKHRL